MNLLALAFLLGLGWNAYSFTLNTNINAGFSVDEVRIWVTSNSTCGNAGISKEELLELAVSAADQFWNTVSTSKLRLRRGGILETSDARFLTGALCILDSQTTSCPAGTIPAVNDIVISCNSNITDNFPTTGGSTNKSLATSLPNNVINGSISGAMIIVNNTPGSIFGHLSRADMIAVLGHEMGHAIGLGHSKTDDNLMYYSTVPKRDRLGSDDIDGVTYLYPQSFDGCGLFKTIKDKAAPPPDFPKGPLAIVFGLLFLTYLNLTRSKKKLVANHSLS